MAIKIDDIIAAASRLTEKPTLSEPSLPKEEVWPEDALLYQPLESQQILLPEYASSLAVQTYLRMCHLPYEQRSCANAEFMSPGGRLTRLPLLRIGRRLLAEFEPIVAHVEQEQPKQALTHWLDEDEREQLATMVTHVENTCTLAELHSCFCSLDTYEEHTWLRNGATYPWPLSMLRRYDRKQDALRILRVYGWHQLDEAGVQQRLRKCLQLVNEKLQEVQAEQEVQVEQKVQVKQEVQAEQEVQQEQEVQVKQEVQAEQEVQEEQKVQVEQEIQVEQKVQVKQEVQAEQKVQVEQVVEVKQEVHVKQEIQLKQEVQVEQAEQREQMYLWGKRPTQLDALLFGHMAAVLSTKFPQVHLAKTVREFPRLVDLCRRIDAECYGGSLMNGEKQEESPKEDLEEQKENLEDNDQKQEDLNLEL